jgi:CHC2 zinc finger
MVKPSPFQGEEGDIPLDFQRIKTIPISEVVCRYGVQLRFRGEWGAAMCPLPSHKKDEKEKTFSVSTGKNYWKCFSASCNESAGCKGGDTINFVALMDGSTQLAAAKKLAGWYGIGEETKAPTPQTKTPERMAKGSSETNLQKATEDHSSLPDTVKYMASVDAWFHETIIPQNDENEDAFKKRFLNAIKSQLIQSYRAGQKSKVA